jgi:hypothetical protein
LNVVGFWPDSVDEGLANFLNPNEALLFSTRSDPVVEVLLEALREAETPFEIMTILDKIAQQTDLVQDEPFSIYGFMAVSICESDRTCIENFVSDCYLEEFSAVELTCLRSLLRGEPVTNTSNLLDLIFVIDTTGSMGDDIDEVKRNALAILERITASEADWRIGIVTYRDHPGYGGDSGDYPSYVDLDFSTNPSQIQSAINAIEVNGGGDTPESVYSGLMTALEFEWRNGAKKAIVLMGDAPPHDPEPVTGLQMDDVLQYAFNLDPVNIYPLLIADNPETRVTFQQLADGSSGRMFYAASAEYVIDTMFTTIGSIAYEPELSRLLEPGEEARVFTTNNDSLNLRENPGLGETILDRLANGEIVTIIDGPIYGDTYLWWNIRTDDDNVGWSVQAADGIITLVPLSFIGDSSYIPPDDRDSTPPDAFLLSGGRGLTDGRILPPGEFQVEWYCGARGLGVSNDNSRWYCNNRGGGVNFTLSLADFDEICKATYGNASAFAVQDGRNGVPAYNWRCYAPR